MRRGFSLIVLCSLLLGILTWQCASSLLIPQNNTQIRSKRVLNKVETTLKIPLDMWNLPSVIQKIEDHEIRYFGHMFDIESKHQDHDTLYLTGYFDIDEDILLALLHQQDGNFQQVRTLAFSLWFEDLNEIPLLAVKTIPAIKQQEYARWSESILSLFYPIWQPPPEIARV